MAQPVAMGRRGGGAAPDLPTQSRLEGRYAQVSADRKGSAATVREIERGKRRAPRGVGEVSPASKPVKIRAAPPVFALCSYLTPSDPCIWCKSGLCQPTCLVSSPFGCYGCRRLHARDADFRDRDARQAIQKNAAFPPPSRAFLPSKSSSSFPLIASVRAESPSVPSVFCTPLRTQRGVSSWVFSGFQPPS